jgi:hypothetical protein
VKLRHSNHSVSNPRFKRELPQRHHNPKKQQMRNKIALKSLHSCAVKPTKRGNKDTDWVAFGRPFFY